VRPVIDHPQVPTEGGPSRDFRNVVGITVSGRTASRSSRPRPRSPGS
jgi:hypothetical protein